MVQAIENRARVTCHAIGPPRPGPATDWSTYTVRIDRVDPLPGWPNLLADAVGREYTAAVPPRLVPLLSARAAWTVEAEVVGPHRITVTELATGSAGGRGVDDEPERAEPEREPEKAEPEQTEPEREPRQEPKRAEPRPGESPGDS